jgi:hypothetical protein
MASVELTQLSKIFTRRTFRRENVTRTAMPAPAKVGATLVPGGAAGSCHVLAFCVDSRRDALGQMAQKIPEYWRPRQDSNLRPLA